MKGKKIAAVQTHGGWSGHVFDDIKRMCKNKKIKTLSVQFDSTGGDTLVSDMSEIEKGISELL